MKNLLSILTVLVLSLVTPLSAETITDDFGRDVEFPVPPQRVIGIHDTLITLPLYEVGVNVVGSRMRANPQTGEYEIWKFDDIFGMTTAASGIETISSSDSIDLELIKSLDPDLIVVDETAFAQVPILESIAPVFVQQVFSGDAFGLSPLRQMAERFGAMDRYNELHSEYIERVDNIRANLDFDPTEKTFLVVLVSDQIMVANGMSGAMQAIADLGFQQPDWLTETGTRAPMVPVSTERIDMLEADFLIVSGGMGATASDEEWAKSALSTLAPGWDRFLQPELGIAYGDASELSTTTFYSAHRMLDLIEAHFGL